MCSFDQGGTAIKLLRNVWGPFHVRIGNEFHVPLPVEQLFLVPVISGVFTFNSCLQFFVPFLISGISF